jgi:plasmid stabilization system protein ParE
MKIKITQSFKEKLNNQVEFIAKDKPSAARKFKNDLLSRIHDISSMPYKNRKSIFFESEDIRDLTFMGYVIVYRINKEENCIEVFGFTKYQDSLI